MNTFTGILQTLVSVIFFCNKCFLLAARVKGVSNQRILQIAWILGTVGAAFGVMYFAIIGLYVFVVAEIGLLVIAAYAATAHLRDSPTEIWLRGALIICMALLSILVSNGALTVLEFLSACCMLIAAYMLSHGLPMCGWAINVLGHLLTAWLAYEKGQYFFEHFQIASALISATGIAQEYYAPSPKISSVPG